MTEEQNEDLKKEENDQKVNRVIKFIEAKSDEKKKSDDIKEKNE